MSVIVEKSGFTIFDDVSWIGLTYFLAGIGAIYLAWRSTYVRHADRFDLYRRRTLFIFNPQTGEFQRHPIIITPQESNTVSNSSNSSLSGTPATPVAPTNETDQLEADADSFPTDSEDTSIAHLQAPPLTLESILDEVNGITSGAHYHAQRQAEDLEAELMDDEAREIIREMDRDINESNAGLRRRLNVYPGRDEDDEEEQITSNIIPSNSTQSVPTADVIPVQSTSELHVDRTETDGNVQVATTSNSADETEAKKSRDECTVDGNESTQSQNTVSNESLQSDLTFGDELTIKLKYLNDDLKIVKARPNEPIGDFKK